MAPGKRKPKQASLWVDTSHLRTHGSHPFCRRLNEILGRANFDPCVHWICRRLFAPTWADHPSRLRQFVVLCFEGPAPARHRFPGR
jgi:hypothetical protein